MQHNPVWKMIYLARRNPKLAAQEFAQAWREHSALGRQCRNVGQRLHAVAQCSRVLHAKAPLLSESHDGVNLMVLADQASGTLIWDDPETLRIMRPDEPRVFADYVRNCALVCQEHVLHTERTGGVRPQNGQVILLGFLQRSSAWTAAAQAPQSLPQAWSADALAHACRVVCNTVQEPGPAEHGFRFVVEWWFEGLKQARAAAQGLAAIPLDGEHGRGDAIFVLTQVTHSRS